MKSRLPKFEFHVSRVVRDQYQFEEEFFSWNGNVLFANPAASRRFAEKMNRLRDVQKHPELAVRPGALNAMGLIDEALHAVMALTGSNAIRVLWKMRSRGISPGWG